MNSFHEKELVKKLPGRYKKTKVICNGFNIDSMKFKPKKFSNIKELKKILVIGRVAYPKNGLNFLKSLSRLNHAMDGYEITWIGRKDTNKRSSKDHLSIKMQNDMDLFLDKNKQIKQKWTWLEHVDDIYKYYENNDVIVIPSVYEGLPMVLCEAMLFWLFCYSFISMRSSKIIGDNERGILCDPLSPESICIALEKFHELNSEKKLLVTEKARRYAVENFDLNLMIKKI